MDSFNNSKFKSAKVNSTKKRRKLRKIAILFRLIEICVVLILISKFSAQVPVAFKISGEYFRGLSVVLVSPTFVFVIGNAIVIALFAKSGHFSGNDSSTKNSEYDIYDEFIQKSEKNQKIHRYEIEYQEKQSRIETNTVAKSYRRTQSEKINRDNCKKSSCVLRRTETEKCPKSVTSGQIPSTGCAYVEDGMSNEEFRRTIEAFIARQQRLRKEEEFGEIIR